MDCNSDCQSWTIWRICQNNCRTFIIHFQRRRVAQNQGKVFGYQITFNIPDDHRNLETQIFAYLIGQYPHSFLHNLSRKIRRFNNFSLNTFIEGSVMAQWKKKRNRCLGTVHRFSIFSEKPFEEALGSLRLFQCRSTRHRDNSCKRFLPDNIYLLTKILTTYWFYEHTTAYFKYITLKNTCKHH